MAIFWPFSGTWVLLIIGFTLLLNLKSCWVIVWRGWRDSTKWSSLMLLGFGLSLTVRDWNWRLLSNERLSEVPSCNRFVCPNSEFQFLLSGFHRGVYRFQFLLSGLPQSGGEGYLGLVFTIKTARRSHENLFVAWAGLSPTSGVILTPLQIILKHKANANCVKIKEHPDGLDFYFSVHNHCTKFLGFLQNVLPVRWANTTESV